MLEESKQAEDSHVPLIHGLPDDLALLCLARVPRRFHHVLRCVSKRWGALLGGEEWSSSRRKNGLGEAWVYVMCRDNCGKNYMYVLDPERHCWKHLQHVPPECVKRQGMSFEAVGSKLYLLGGCGWDKDLADDVYCYDPSAEKWEVASKMPTARGFFLSAVIGNKIYVTSGLGLGPDPNVWDIYDAQSNIWRSKSNSVPVVDLEKFTSFDDKIYTFNKAWDLSRYARVYDPSSRKWESVNNDISFCHCGPTVVVNGTLYMLDETCGTRLRKWLAEEERWVSVGRLAVQLARPPCQLAAVGRSIFVIGKGLSTVVVNTDMTSSVGGMLVASSIPPHLSGGFDVVGCKTIAI